MRRWNRAVILSVAALLCLPGAALAQVQTSTSYSVIQSEIGAQGQLNSGSTSYSLKPGTDDGGSVLGQDTSSGNSSSTSYQTNAGYGTTAQPGLMMTVNSGSVNFPPLSTSAAQFASATFDVRDYTSYGYAVQIIGTPPTYHGYPLNALASDTASSAGTEQFGINTVYNTVAGVGANPIQLPSGSFSFGVAGDGATGTYGSTRPYTISDKYKFVSGGVIASAPKTSGDTKYTVTFMANISTLTPGGSYTGAEAIVATGTY
jgi:hypothetical protein